MKKLFNYISLFLLIIPLDQKIIAQGNLKSLETELNRIGELSGGTLGLGVIHIETGQRVYINNSQRYPMASTYKVPIAVQLLKRVENGEIKLEDMITVNQYDLHPGSGSISELLINPGVILSIRNLLELMMLISDNSATDMMLKAAGGAKNVNSTLRKNNIKGMQINRSTVELISDWVGVDLEEETEFSNQKFLEIYKSKTKEELEKAKKAFSKNFKDTSTPKAMAVLLEKIWKKDILSDENSELLIDIMSRCKTGENRLKGFLPEKTYVAHKTGTIGSTTNDVGIIKLPNDKGHVIVVAFIKDSEIEMPEREKAIAHAARAVHDYFLFN